VRCRDHGSRAECAANRYSVDILGSGNDAVHSLVDSRVVPNTGVDRASVGMARPRGEAGSPSSAEGTVLDSAVKITSAERVKRLGTGYHWWFSESVHVPIGTKIKFHFRGPTHLLALYDQGVRKNGETSIDLHSSKLRSFTHKLTFVPAGCTYREWHETAVSTRVTFLHLHPAAFWKSDDDNEDALLPRIYFEDSFVWETASKLKNAIERAQAKSIPYLRALSGVLSHELSQVDGMAARQPSVSRGGLAGWQKRAVVDYVEEHLGQQIGLPKLAELAELSLHHFCRAFKQSFGIPPHQYQVRQRMEVAKSLLADRKTSVTDIALSLGYAQISSFSCAFHKATGWTPSVYRREFK
jgi:AraC family transcriptional regulator